MTGDLNGRQIAFINAYLGCNEATSAAKTAGYSAKSAQVIGCQLLKHPKVAAEIARRRQVTEKKSALSAQKIYDELNNLVDFDPGQLFDADGKLLPINQIPLEARKALAGVDGGKLRFSSRLGAIELGAKLLGMVKQEQNTQQAVQIIISQPRAQHDVTVETKQLKPEWD